MYKFYQILFFVLKNDHYFKSCKNMITIFSFSFFLVSQAKIFFIVIHIMPPFTFRKLFLELEISEIIFWFKKKIKYHKFKIMSAFHMWMVGYHHFKKF
jgi:hypothetical protein